MASLSSILQAKGDTFYAETPKVKATDIGYPGRNVDQYNGIDVYTPCGQTASVPSVNYTATAAGTLVIDVWGSSGSGARMCCCGMGIPGNAGAYARKIVNVQAGDTVTGTVGIACGNVNLCLGGRGTASCITINTAANGCECICAEGGFGGIAVCVPSTSPYCCFASVGFCQTAFGSSCGIICNVAGPQSAVAAQAFGGDINKPGGTSVTCFICCGISSASPCSRYQRIPISPGIVSTETSYVEITNNGSDSSFETSGNSAYHEMSAALSGLSRSFNAMYKHNACWSSDKWCGCYDNLKCQSLMPVGVPAPGMTVHTAVRDSGIRGGHGMVKIKFIGS